MKLAYPIPEEYIGHVTQTYEQHVQLKAEKKWNNYNGGIDWGVPEGTRIGAAADGQVIEVKDQGAMGYGLHVVMSHGEGLMTIYAHLSAVMVKVGQGLRACDQIGLSGNTGFSSGPHLHFEAREWTAPFDPMPYLQKSDRIRWTGIVLASLGLKVKAGPGSNYDRVGPGLMPYEMHSKRYDIDEIRDGWAHVFPDRGWVAIGPAEDPWLKLEPVSTETVAPVVESPQLDRIEAAQASMASALARIEAELKRLTAPSGYVAG